MKLVVGLGNPGRKYEKTRHNIGFDVVAQFARLTGNCGKIQAKFQAELTDCHVNGTKVLLLLPQTYMNRSGQSVKACVDFYKIDLEDILVVCDDFHLPLGKLRFRPRGTSGGQKGLQDILRHLGSEEIARLRVGIGEPPENWDVADYVLSKFTKQELPEVENAICRAAQGIEDWVRHGIAYCMNRYNGM